MNRISQLLSAIVTAAAASASVANASINVDGYTWDYAYTGDGDVLPTASSPAWTSAGSASATMSGGEVTINTPTGDDTRYFLIDEGAEWNPVSPGVAYVQFRAKVNSENGRVAGGIYFGGDSDSIALNLGNENVSGITGIFDNAYNLVATVDVFQYHTYRVAFDPDAGTYTLWIDDFAPANFVASGSNFSGGPYMYFGDGSGDHGGSVTWDYVAWNNNGAPVAVPEPTGLSLLAIGALAMAYRRRK